MSLRIEPSFARGRHGDILSSQKLEPQAGSNASGRHLNRRHPLRLTAKRFEVFLAYGNCYLLALLIPTLHTNMTHLLRFTASLFMLAMCATHTFAQGELFPAPNLSISHHSSTELPTSVADWCAGAAWDSNAFVITDDEPRNRSGTLTLSPMVDANQFQAMNYDGASGAQAAIATSGANNVDVDRFQTGDRNGNQLVGGLNVYSPPDFEDGLIVFGKDIAMKIGGFVKADFIHDLKPIDSTDSFITTTIPVGARQRTNSRFHTRQTRLSFDTRWASKGQVVKIFVEGDFFDQDLFEQTRSSFRLRHAYGEVGSLLVGRYWTTFTDVSAAPYTIDFEGSVSNVNRRRAQARWTQSLNDHVTLALAVEDTSFIIEAPPDVPGEARSPSPDFVGHMRWEDDRAQLQLAGVYRIGAFQPDGLGVVSTSAWGLNATGSILITEPTRLYYQVMYGEGIGSYRGLPDAAPETNVSDKLLPIFGWMCGLTHEWSERWSSNLTYAENSLDNAMLQSPDDVRRVTYLAANLVWNPIDRVFTGIEYLYGLRENIDLAVGVAHRIQVGFIFDLP